MNNVIRFKNILIINYRRYVYASIDAIQVFSTWPWTEYMPYLYRVLGTLWNVEKKTFWIFIYEFEFN